MNTGREVYLGDGVYASFDGFHVWLRTGGTASDRIALEPAVLAALNDYVHALQKELSPRPPADPPPPSKPERPKSVFIIEGRPGVAP